MTRSQYAGFLFREGQEQKKKQCCGRSVLQQGRSEIADHEIYTCHGQQSDTGCVEGTSKTRQYDTGNEIENDEGCQGKNNPSEPQISRVGHQKTRWSSAGRCPVTAGVYGIVFLMNANRHDDTTA